MVMTNKERYQAKKAAAHKREMILDLMLINGEIKFQYAGGKTYKLRSDISNYNNGTKDWVLSVWTDEIFGRGMNVDKVTNTALKLYSYDMMGTQTTYSMDINKMDFIIGEPEQQPEF
mgnify:CR=1 FL=1